MKAFAHRLRRAAARLDDWQMGLLLLSAPVYLLITPRLSPLLVILPLLWLVTLLAGRNPLPVTPLNPALLLLLVMLAVSVLVTPDLVFSLPKIAGVLLGIGVYFAVLRVGERARGWWWALVGYLLAGGGVAALGLAGTRWFAAKIAGVGRLAAQLPALVRGLPGAPEGFHPNEVGGALLWVAPVWLAALAAVVLERRALAHAWGVGRSRILIGMCLAANLFVFGVLVLTQSRSAYLGLALAGLALALLPLRRRRRRKWLVLALLVLLAAAVWLGPFGVQVLLPGGAGGEPGVMFDTLEGRVEIWSRALAAIHDFPLTGIGMNTFRRLVHVLYPLFLVSPGTDIGHAHNEFLQAALDVGLPGLAAFLALYGGVFAMLVAAWLGLGRRRRLPFWRAYRALVLGLCGALLAHLVFGLSDAVALGAKPGFLWWALLGLSAGLFRLVNERKAVAGRSDVH